MNFETMSNQRKMVLIAAAVGIICMFLPWISISIPILGQTASSNGMRGWGIVVFACFVIAGFLAFSGDQSTNLNRTNWMAVLIAGGIASLIMIINFIKSMDVLSVVGFGFYGALVASIGVVAFAFMHRSASDSLQGGFDSLKGEINRKMNSTNSGSTTTTTGSATTVTHTPTDEPTRPIV